MLVDVFAVMNALTAGPRASRLFPSFTLFSWAYLSRAGRAAGLALVLWAARPGNAAPANDFFTNAVVLAGASGSTTGSTVGATTEPGEPAVTGNGGASVWFRWVAPVSGTVVFSTGGSSFDTELGVYTGTAVAALTVVGQNDDIEPGVVLTSAVTFVAAAGTEYRIMIEGYAGHSGNYTLTWLYPVVNEGVLSTAVTNVSNFVYRFRRAVRRGL